MNWFSIWLDPKTGRLRSGWRAVVYLIASLFMTLMVYITALSAYTLFLHAPPPPTSYASELIPRLSAIIGFVMIAVVALRYFEQLPPYTLGLHLDGGRQLVALTGGFGLGVGIILAVLLILYPLHLVTFRLAPFTPQMLQEVGLGAAGFLILGVFEEVLFRGYFFQTLLRGAGPFVTLLLTAALFTAAHLGNPNNTLLAGANIFLAGIVFGCLYLRHGSLWLPIGVHAGWNVALLFFQIPISGITLAITTPVSATITGSSLITGGAFGLEGGVCISCVLLGLIYALTHLKVGLPLDSNWWEWRDFAATRTPPPVWDFTIDARHYQWKLLPQDPLE